MTTPRTPERQIRSIASSGADTWARSPGSRRVLRRHGTLVAVVEGRWIEPSYESVYHGKADGPDGPAWVFPRVHTGAGLHVEVHRAAPDGLLIRRIAVTHDRAATVSIDKLRDTMLRDGLEAISGEVEPLIPRGSVIVHAGQPRTLKPVAALDRGPATFLCARIWVLPGTHQLTSAFVSDKLAFPPDPQVAKTHGRANIEVDVGEYETVEFYYSFFLRRVLRHRPPPTHWLCRIHHAATA